MERQYEHLASTERLPKHLQQARLYYPCNEPLSEELTRKISMLSDEFGMRICYFPLTPDPGYSNGYELMFDDGPWIERPFSTSFTESITEFVEYLVENY